MTLEMADLRNSWPDMICQVRMPTREGFRLCWEKGLPTEVVRIFGAGQRLVAVVMF